MAFVLSGLLAGQRLQATALALRAANAISTSMEPTFFLFDVECTVAERASVIVELCARYEVVSILESASNRDLLLKGLSDFERGVIK